MATSNWTPIGPTQSVGNGAIGQWRNNATGQMVYGLRVGPSGGLRDTVIPVDRNTGQQTLNSDGSKFHYGSDGSIIKDPTLGDTLKDAALIYSAPLAIGALAGVGGTSAAAAASGDVVKNSITNMAGQPIDAAGNVAAAGKSFLDNPYVKEALSIGTNLGSSLITSGSIDRAQAAQQAATQKALDLNTSIYQQARASLDPFISRGNSAGNTLAALYGIAPSSPSPAAPSAPVAAAPAATPAMPPQMTAPAITRGPQTLASMAAPSPAQSVAVKAPTGQVYMVPQAQLQEAIAQGGVPLNG